MTRKHYNAIAQAIRGKMDFVRYDDITHITDSSAVEEGIIHAAQAMAKVFAADNPRFDRNKFLVACRARS